MKILARKHSSNMRRALIFLILTLVTGAGFAKVSLTVNVTVPGGLNNAMTAEQRNSVTDLTVTGLLNATDFVTLRDKMPVLSVLDLSGTSIRAYSGTQGPILIGGSTTFPADELPYCAFFNSVTHAGKASLTSVILPNTLKTVGLNALQYCSNLTEASFPASVDTIRDWAYYQCTALKSANIPANIKYIGIEAFTACTGNFQVDAGNPYYSSLDGVLFNKDRTCLIQCQNSKQVYTIPSTVTTIGMSAFKSCKSLVSCTIPESVRKMESYAFDGCGLTSLRIPSSLKKIPYMAFSSCTGLGSVVFPSRMETIGEFSFVGCTSLDTLLLPDAVSMIGISAFDFCNALVSVTFPAEIDTLAPGTFSRCSSLVSVCLPPTLKTLTTSTFTGCTGLKKVIIPSSVRTIQGNVFGGCTALEEIHVQRPVPADLSGSVNVFKNVPVATCILYVPAGSKAAYAAADKWKDFLHIVEEVPVLNLNSTALEIAATAGSMANLNITSTLTWTAVSDQLWLQVSPFSGGTCTGKISLSAYANPLSTTRMADVTISAPGIVSQIVKVTQQVAAGSGSQATTFVITNERGLLDELIAAGFGDSSLYRVLLFLQPASGSASAGEFMAALAAAPPGSDVFITRLNSRANSTTCINADGTVHTATLSGREYYGKTGYAIQRESRKGAGRIFYSCAGSSGFFIDAGASGTGAAYKAFMIVW